MDKKYYASSTQVLLANSVVRLKCASGGDLDVGLQQIYFVLAGVK